MDALLNFIQMILPFIHSLKDAIIIALIFIVGILCWYIIRKDNTIKYKDQKIEDFLDGALKTNERLSDIIDILKDLIRNRR